MRQDPDVIMVGEIRDAETAVLVAKAAQTGHLLLSQLHAKNGVSALKLLFDLGIPVYQLREITTGIISQRLVRRLCSNCKQQITQEEMKQLPKAVRSTGNKIFKPAGCNKCHQTGYRGRTIMIELFEPDKLFWQGLSSGKTVDELEQTLPASQKQLWDDGIRLVADGITSFMEINRVLG